MPILSFRIGATEEKKDGQKVDLTPRHALQRVGPVVPVTIHPLPVGSAGPETSIAGRALIDTGAAMTCVDQKSAEQAGLAIVDSARMASATHSGEIVPVFAGRLVLKGLLTTETKRAYGANLEPQGLIALIGRDILANCELIYHGPTGFVSLAI